MTKQDAGIPEEDAVSAVAARRPMPRSASWGGGAVIQEGRRRTYQKLEPEALAQLHKLHENFLRYSSPEPVVEDTSHAALDAAWETSESIWQVYGALPKGSERPFVERPLRLLAAPSVRR